MQPLSTIETLRQSIAALENRPVLDPPKEDPQGDAPPRGADLLAAPAGLLHDLYASHPRESGLLLGAALGLARPLLSGGRPAILWLQPVADGQELGLPYGPGLDRFGIPAKQVVFARLGSIPDLLWAMEEALGCSAIAAVIADMSTLPKAFDFTASRRLGMRAQAGGSSAFVLRYGAERVMSAAHLRWAVSPAPSAADPFDARAPGRPRLVFELERSRLARNAIRPEGARLVVDWTEHGFLPAQNRFPAAQRPARRPPPSGAVPPPLGHGLSQAG